MPTYEEEYNSLIESTKQYLMQQADLFGNIIYTEEQKQAAPQGLKFSSVYPDEAWTRSASLDEQNGQICNCLKCGLGQTRTNFVFGVGNPNADVMFIGEAPGADEDAQGIPFVGRAGQLLTKIIEAVQMKRDDVYICNILKCRPPNNRDPEPAEMETCTPYLYKQIEIIKPKFIICLGRISAQWILKTNSSLGGMRGKVHDFHGIKLIVTYHPAALLRNPNWKYDTWEDMKMFKRLYDEMKA
ncbi:MAG: uracil-DNA glycosylase [Bacteroidetes bacterium]|nr:MAG: uracil-DNA glycosylase [Bacteroidota bacterium]